MHNRLTKYVCARARACVRSCVRACVRATGMHACVCEGETESLLMYNRLTKCVLVRACVRACAQVRWRQSFQWI